MRPCKDFEANFPSEVAKACTRHLAMYLVADLPPYPELSNLALTNFLPCYEKLLTLNDFTNELCKVTEMALNNIDSQDWLAEKILVATLAKFQVVQKIPALLEILEAKYPWIRQIYVESGQSMQNGSDKILILEDAKKELLTALEAKKDEVVKLKESNAAPEKQVERQEAANKSLRMRHETLQAAHQSLQDDHKKLLATQKTANESVKAENERLHSVIKGKEETESILKGQLDDAMSLNAILEVTKKISNDKANDRIRETERQKEIAEAANKLLEEELLNVKETLRVSKVNAATAIEAENKLRREIKAENVKLKEQAKEFAVSAQQRRAVMLQNQIEALKTAHQDETQALKDATFELKEDLVKAERSCVDRTERVKYLEKRIVVEQDARTASSDRAIRLEKRLQKNDELLQSQDELRKVAEKAADIARDKVEALRQAAQHAQNDLDARKQQIESLKQQVETKKKELERTKKQYQDKNLA